MNTELMEALEVLEKEKNISKESLLEAIEQSLLQACKNHFGKADNVKVVINSETGDFHVTADKEVVEEVEDPVMQMHRHTIPAMNLAISCRWRSSPKNLAVSPHRTRKT